MPVAPTYPGVYIEEVPSGVHTITGVSTSITAFVGYTSKGPVDEPVRVFNLGEFENQFGGLTIDSELAYAVWQYFLNGGSDAYVVRVADGTAAAAVTMLRTADAPNPPAVLTLTAKAPGSWGNLLRADVDFDTSEPQNTFNLHITEYRRVGIELVPGRTETHRNLSMNSHSPQYAVDVVGAGSQLADATREADPNAAAIKSSLPSPTSVGGTWAVGDLPDEAMLRISIDSQPAIDVVAWDAGGKPADAAGVCTAIKTTVSAASPVDIDATSAAGNAITLKYKTAGDVNEFAAIRVLPAPSQDLAPVLGLGSANGGIETESASWLRPAQTGTVSAPIDLTGLDLSGPLKLKVKVSTLATDATAPTIEIDHPDPAPQITSGADLAAVIQSMIRGADPNNPVLTGTAVEATGNRLRIVTGGADPSTEIAITNSAAQLKKYGLSSASFLTNVQSYAMGTGVVRDGQSASTSGVDGTPPTELELMGDESQKSGIHALDKVDLFNLLCIPDLVRQDRPFSNDAVKAVLATALAYVSPRRAFLIVDPPATVQTVNDAKDWVSGPSGFAPTPDSKNAALYFPATQVSDPLNGFRDRTVAASGAVAGIYARTDVTRGVWKAPAGAAAGLSNVSGFQTGLTNDENGVLNQIGVNCLRYFPAYGRVVWGARTMLGSDAQASEWKYVPIRRLALYLEESLYRGMQWVVFEPNDEPLWAQIRTSVGVFMHGLFRQQAFQGASPREAYFVKCNDETTTQDDINHGVVNVSVGFAPLKPAEFVVIQIQQIAGQLAA
jgi:phage tail sheath protein FI